MKQATEPLLLMFYGDSIVEQFGKHYTAHLLSAARAGEVSPILEAIVTDAPVSGILSLFSIRRPVLPDEESVDIERQVRIGRRRLEHSRDIDKAVSRLIGRRVRALKRNGKFTERRLLKELNNFDILLLRVPPSAISQHSLPFAIQDLL